MASNSIGLINEANFISSGEQERYQHFSFLSLEVSFGSLRERERETVDNFPEITRNRKKKMRSLGHRVETASGRY